MILYDEANLKANGGTEMMMRGLENRIPHHLLDKVNISRSCELFKPTDLTNVYWTHEVPAGEGTYEHEYLTKYKWQPFQHIVFVSNWQMNEYIKRYNFTWADLDRIRVLKNAIDPIEAHEKPTDKIRLIYTSNPVRGLDILCDVFERLSKEYDDIELEVFSSNSVYGNKDDGQELFERLKSNPKVIYHGGKSNVEVREGLKRSHIFAYPCTYGETSCIALMEAMSAGLLCVHPDQAALFETAGGMTEMYHYCHDPEKHKEIFYLELKKAINAIVNKTKSSKLELQKKYSEEVFGWYNREIEWANFLESL